MATLRNFSAGHIATAPVRRSASAGNGTTEGHSVDGGAHNHSQGGGISSLLQQHMAALRNFSAGEPAKATVRRSASTGKAHHAHHHKKHHHHHKDGGGGGGGGFFSWIWWLIRSLFSWTYWLLVGLPARWIGWLYSFIPFLPFTDKFGLVTVLLFYYGTFSYGGSLFSTGKEDAA